MWSIAVIAALQLLFFSSVQTEGQDGINFCVPTLCYCVPELMPIEISCDGIQLKSFWEESDWNVTLTALNLTGNEPLSLTFIGNELEHVPIFPAINITMLLLQNNKIKSIESSAFSHLLSLETLNLAHNSLTADSLMEGIFFGQFKTDGSGYFPMPLKHLNLSYNNIHSIPKDTFDHFTSLTTIDLGHNPLTTLEGNSKYSISYLLKLNFLGLSNTSISGLPDGMLHDLIALGSLDLSYNSFTKVPKELSQSHELKVLNLDGNLFETLDKDSFQGLGKLADLSICHMHTLRRIEQYAFTPLKNLTKLVMAFNPLLKEIDDGAFQDLIKKDSITKEDEDNWPITEIHLNDNGLKQIDQALLPWMQLDYVDIQNNPFRCDCNLEWMVTKLVERVRLTNPTLTSDLTCAEPKDMKGKSINTLTKERNIFGRCSRDAKGKYGNLIANDYDPTESDPIKAAGVTILVIGILLVVIGLSFLGFLVVKRRAITQALTAPSSQIRYERADTEDGSEWRYSQPSSIYK